MLALEFFFALLLCIVPLPVLAKSSKPDGYQQNAPDYADYCFLAINTVMGSYTFQDPSAASTTSSAASGDSTAGSSSSHGSGSGHHRKRAHGGSSTAMCNVQIEVISLYATAKAYCDTKQWKATIPYWQSLCAAAGTTLMDLTAIEANVTAEYIATLPIIDPNKNSTSTTMITKPVLLDQSYYELQYKTSYYHDYAYTRDGIYGWGLMAYWGGVLVLGMIHKACLSLLAFRDAKHLSTASDIEGANQPKARNIAPSLLSKSWHLLRTWVIIPAGLAPYIQRHQVLFMLQTIPRRIDSIIVAGFWILCVVLGFVGYDTFAGNLSFSTIAYQNWQYSADRTGILSYACLPFLWLFGQRNNPFLTVTSFTFRSFNIFHRHVAWICVIYAIIHSINYTVLYTVYSSSYASSYSSNYFYMGVVATIVMSLLLVLSNAWLRKRWYEIFLITHILFALLVLYALYCHVNFQVTTWMVYVWPPVAIWSFDRAVRITRMLYCNLRVFSGKNLFKTTSSTVQYFEDSDLLKINVSVPGGHSSFSLIKPGPGQHYFLYQPFALRGWESHPFTLAGYSRPVSRIGSEVISSSHASSTVLEASKAKSTGHQPVSVRVDTVPDSPSSTAGPNLELSPKAAGVQKHSQGSDLTLSFCVRPHSGWTRRLRTLCKKDPSSITYPHLILEGPYGHSSPLYLFDTVLFIVGGTGIASALPYMQDHVERSSGRTCKTRTSKLHLIWSAKQDTMFHRIIAENSDVFVRNDVIVDSFCTDKKPASLTERSSVSSSPASHLKAKTEAKTLDPGVQAVATGVNINSEKGEKPLSSPSTPSVEHPPAVTPQVNVRQFYGHRPDISQLISQTADEGKASSTTVAVLVCGPSQMADQCRNAVFEVLQSGFSGIEYFEETFGW